MRNFKMNVFLTMTIYFVLTLAACGQTGSETENTQGFTVEERTLELTVSVAASLTSAMEEIKTAYKKKRPNIIIAYNFGSSGSLQKQIEQGAQVDVFVSAATKQMDALKDKGLIIEDTRKNFLENKIVLIVPEGSTGIYDFEDLLEDKVKRIGLGEPNSVPVGQYAEEVLKELDIIGSIKSKVVYAKDVKEVLTWVETGNANAGIVYETDTKVSNKVKLVAKAPEGTHKPVCYPAAVIKESKNTEAAKDFVDFLYSSKAKPIFENYGFVFMLE